MGGAESRRGTLQLGGHSLWTTAAVVAVDGNPLEQDGGSMDTYDPNQSDVKKAIQSSIELGLAAVTY